ncbi:bifunctional lysylphosphatidylglycerol flippase/synthetase MprF [Agrobacterium vitis]|uniref:bifunctional lysylphosphatidylglycerol flippase/synthetase MprF n=1 Tax=Agrobacterium vitis TaxID=373 RepID=UPI001574D51C|nr:bifunctional lysylphosphatidylglycerol flippase/synthetase MprF [Agrobacterium vitis]NSZ17973.1 bifunctional lysylphosphatidylglycerol flippase/synthetase MprF [Agrobacterium vitis]QZO03724.1 bifunctional lysylphosphatidylglycerol flippase/synthetase MprF [Agrobacterium vitis]UJL88849.1 bifunctional lysylphosphatidylglycerol flippase/synthetase MprF [Agrobacterium vitis]
MAAEIQSESQESAEPPTRSGWRAALADYGRAIAAVFTLVIFAAVALAIYRLTEEVSYDDVVSAMATTGYDQILLAVVFTALSFLSLCLYDWNAMEFIGRKRPMAEVALTAFSAYAVGNAAGFGMLSGGAIRYRAYSRAGLAPDEIGRIIAFVTLSFSLGLAAVTALSLIPMSSEIAPLLNISPLWLRGLAIAIVLGFAVLIVIGQRRSLTFAGVTLRMADTPTLSRQFLVTVADLAFSASVVYALLPGQAAISWPAFFAIYSIAIGIGVLSHVPAGIGVFETVIIAALGPTTNIDAVLASLVVYRLIYYVLPLILAIVLVTITELRHYSKTPALAGVGRTAARISPALLGALTFILGVMLIFSSVTPTPESNLEFLQNIVPLPVVEGAHFFTSLLGLFLVIAARGLAQRLDGAWWAAMVGASTALVLSLLKAFAVLEASALAILLIGLFASKRLFIRPASLFRQVLTSSWLTAIALICIFACFILFFVYRDVDYTRSLWWEFEFSEEAPRSLRAMLGLTIFSSALAVFSLLRPAAPAVTPSSPEDIEKAVAILSKSDVADSNLVRTGDKAVMFSPDGLAFLMYGKQGRSWIAFLDPVGPKKSRDELVWQFVESARLAGCRAVFYQASPVLLPAIADAGMQAFKLGELAVVDLSRFDLKGGKWANLRQSAAKAERDGLSYEIIPLANVPDILEDLRAVSDGWLAQHRAKEKGFSLGAFTDDYILSQPVIVLRFEGRIVAFANILVTETKAESSIDLMRFSPEAPKGSMDYLFVSLLTHLRSEGYEHFNLGMAPLSGLSRRDVAPVWDRIANTFYEHGERFYNFKGLRAFKTKFHPEWQPRYLAVSGGLSPVIALLDATLLIGGGLKGVVKK